MLSIVFLLNWPVLLYLGCSVRQYRPLKMQKQDGSFVMSLCSSDDFSNVSLWCWSKSWLLRRRILGVAINNNCRRLHGRQNVTCSTAAHTFSKVTAGHWLRALQRETVGGQQRGDEPKNFPVCSDERALARMRKRWVGKRIKRRGQRRAQKIEDEGWRRDGGLTIGEKWGSVDKKKINECGWIINKKNSMTRWKTLNE